jgi:hypothetical protein
MLPCKQRIGTSPFPFSLCAPQPKDFSATASASATKGTVRQARRKEMCTYAVADEKVRSKCEGKCPCCACSATSARPQPQTCDRVRHSKIEQSGEISTLIEIRMGFSRGQPTGKQRASGRDSRGGGSSSIVSHLGFVGCSSSSGATARFRLPRDVRHLVITRFLVCLLVRFLVVTLAAALAIIVARSAAATAPAALGRAAMAMTATAAAATATTATRRRRGVRRGRGLGLLGGFRFGSGAAAARTATVATTAAAAARAAMARRAMTVLLSRARAGARARRAARRAVNVARVVVRRGRRR